MKSTANIFYCEKWITVKKIVQLKTNTAIVITVRGEGAGKAIASLRRKKLAESDFLRTLRMHLEKKGSNFMLTFSAKLFRNNFFKREMLAHHSLFHTFIDFLTLICYSFIYSVFISNQITRFFKNKKRVFKNKKQVFKNKK